jgi:formylglycine-generating enzyme required for sulfatase activity
MTSRIHWTALALGLAVARDPCLATPLHEAVRTNGLSQVSALLEQGEPGLANRTIQGGITPLHLAAALNLTQAANLLLKHGADPNAATDGGFTPLHWAANRDASETAKLLIAVGARVGAATPNGIAPLHWAAQKNAAETVRLLLAAGADVEAETESGLTPLHYASAKDAKEAAVVLAYRAVSQQMEREERKDAAKAATAFAPKPVEPPPAAAASEPPVRSRVLPFKAFGKMLAVPIGFGEVLTFVWIEPLGLWFGQYEITNGQFRRFRPKHSSSHFENISLDGPSQPAVYVSWHDAAAFCQWLTRGFADRIPPDNQCRLPSEREWSFAASCGDKRTYPWGEDWPPKYGNFSDLTARTKLSEWRGITGYDDGFPVSCPVASSGENEWGLFGLAGNVWEWCEDWYDRKSEHKVRRGGSWDFDTKPNLRVAARGFDKADARYDTIGFRVVIAPTR